MPCYPQGFRHSAKSLSILSPRNMAQNFPFSRAGSRRSVLFSLAIHSSPEWKRPQRKTHGDNNMLAVWLDTP
jgi:hypothetical protein